jgi:8-oxo-dGTP pyrophosphatase MutT (NUDIX family)
MNETELVDLVDANGHVRQTSVTRLEVKRKFQQLTAAGLYQPIVVVVVFDARGDVIAQVRGPRKSEDGAGEIDHLTGVIAAGESWDRTAIREAREELGISLGDLRKVTSGVNVYSRHRTLATAHALGNPSVQDPQEVATILIESPAQLRVQGLGQARRFVKGYFEDLDTVLTARSASAGRDGEQPE